jgi:hypothetical protein
MTDEYFSLVRTLSSAIRDDSAMGLDCQEPFLSRLYLPSAGVSQSTSDQYQREGADSSKRIGCGSDDIQRRPLRRCRSTPGGTSGSLLQESRGYGAVTSTEPTPNGGGQAAGSCWSAAVGVGRLFPTIYASKSRFGASSPCVQPLPEARHRGERWPGSTSEGSNAELDFPSRHSSVAWQHPEACRVGQLCRECRDGSSNGVDGGSWLCRSGCAIGGGEGGGKEGESDSEGTENKESEAQEQRDRSMLELQFSIGAGSSQIPARTSTSGIPRVAGAPPGDHARYEGGSPGTKTGVRACGLAANLRSPAAGKTATASIDNRSRTARRSSGRSVLPVSIKGLQQRAGVRPMLIDAHKKGQSQLYASPSRFTDLINPPPAIEPVHRGMSGIG